MFDKLRHRLTIIFISLAVIPILTLSVFYASRQYNQIQNDVVASLQQLTQQVSVQSEALIVARQNELNVIAKSYGLGELSVSDQTNVLQSVLFGQEAYERIALVDSTGMELAAVSRFDVITTKDLVNRAQDPEFVNVMTRGKPYYGDIRSTANVNEPTITLALPIVDLKSGNIKFVLISELRFKLVWNLLHRLNLPNGKDVFLTDTSGHVIAHGNPSIVLRDTTFTLPESDGQSVGISGDPAFVVKLSLPLENRQFYVVAEESLTQALAPASQQLLLSLVVALISALVAVTLVVLIVRQIVRPIERLSIVATAIRQGDLNTRTEITSRDEIGTLARSFNDMADQLQVLVSTLEERVLDRTRDLALASEVSAQAATELDTARLFEQVVSLTAKSFDLYHVSIFLFDNLDQQLHFVEGSGGAGVGKVEATRRSRQLTEKGLVAQAARTRVSALANNVLEFPDFLPNSELPATRSELAVPMLFKGELIGVLDLQADQQDRFSDDDVRIMITLAEQIGAAVRNAQLYTDAQSALNTAKRSDQVKSAFLASMSHELRTPLNAIINFTKFVANETMGPVNADQKEALGEVIDSGKHLLSLINDVLDMSKIEAGSLKLFVEDNVIIRPILETATSTARSLTTEKPIEVILETDDNLPPISVDRQRVLQILLNLVSNASKFTEKGSIRIRAERCSENLIISVVDTGPGISLGDQEAVFKPFEQTDTGLRQGGGTGLGMPISRSLAEAHGGRLWLESIEGQGTTFYLSLPLHADNIKPVILMSGVK